MSRRMLVSFFDHEDDIVGASLTVREAGLRIASVYTPYAVHGLDKAMDLPPSKLPFVSLLLGVLGAAFTLWFKFWTTAVDWPINVGGKPWDSLPAFVPVTFEVMVLCAGVSVVIAFLIVSRLRPGRQAVLADPGVTDHRFVLVIEQADAVFDPVKVHELLKRFHVVRVEERVESAEPGALMRLRSLNLLFLICIAIIGVLNWIIRRDFSRPNLQFLPEMVQSVPYDSFSVNPNFPDEKTLQQPVPGTIPRGLLPLHYEATSQDYARAGEELQNPYSGEDQAAVQRGGVVYTNFCLPCHGVTGKGDGPVVSRGYPPPPPLYSSVVASMKDGQIFYVTTYGQRNMPSHATQISPEDRWKVILYIRTLQLPKLPAQSSGPA